MGRSISNIKSFKKLAEGGFNRVFELTMRDGVQVIARLPYPMTRPEHLTVASEVATMDLVRRKGVPVPKVVDYSADADNLVGAEYILMEKVQGTPLSDVWFTMSEKERIKVLSGIVDCEAKLFDINLPANGSLYYSKDLPQSMERSPLPSTEHSSEALCIGPDVSLKFWFEERSNLSIPRKPFVTAADVLEGGALKEIAWLQTYARPRMPFDRMYRDITEYQKSQPEEHLENLQNYLKVTSYLAPKESWLSRPTLRHPDLTPNNIFVSKDSEIEGIIDWQHAKVLPLFLHAGIPAHFQNYGDPESEDLVKPQLPADIHERDEDDRESEFEQYRRRHVHFYYVGATASKNKLHFDALMHEGGLFRRRLYEHAVEPWEGNSIPLKADLVRLEQEWSTLVGTGDGGLPPCPITFEAEDAGKVLKQAAKQDEVDSQMQILRSAVGAGTDGWAATDKFEQAKAESERIKAWAIEHADDDAEREETKKYWPFDDFDERE